MSALEDTIRDSLRSEAARLREVRPLALPPAASRRGARGARARALRPWLAPVAAVAAVLLIATAGVTLRSMRGDQPAPSVGLRTTAGTIPQYFMSERWVKDGADKDGMGLAWVVTDAQTGNQAGYVPLPDFRPDAGSWVGQPIAAAADDRTFVAAEAVTRPGPTTRTADGQTAQGLPVVEALKWYLLRFSPGSADPLRLTPLSLPSSVASGRITGMALSGDGTELAVAYRTTTLVTLQVYSVPTGPPRHSWTVTVPAPAKGNTNPFASPFATVTNLSWVGDATVGFTFTSGSEPRADVRTGLRANVHEEIRTLSIDDPRTSLLTASHAVWSLDVPLAAYALAPKGSSQACSSPRLSGNGQVVVCGTATYSPASGRLTTTWLAYPVADPERPRVLASVQESIAPVDVPTLSPASTVDWVNASGTTIIGDWSHQIDTHGDYASPGHTAAIGSGTIQLLPGFHGDPEVAW